VCTLRVDAGVDRIYEGLIEGLEFNGNRVRQQIATFPGVGGAPTPSTDSRAGEMRPLNPDFPRTCGEL
jgi:hypothetical protein